MKLVFEPTLRNLKSTHLEQGRTWFLNAHNIPAWWFTPEDAVTQVENYCHEPPILQNRS